MLRLRQYKSCDAVKIAEWVQDGEVFQNWGGHLFGEYPINAKIIEHKYKDKNGDCAQADNFYPWTAIDEAGNPVGHFIMRYIHDDSRVLRFGWVIVDEARRGRGYGRQMLEMGLKYAFDILGVYKVTLGVYENNRKAHWCYKSVGFTDVGIEEREPYNVIEMEITKEEYYMIYG